MERKNPRELTMASTCLWLVALSVLMSPAKAQFGNTNNNNIPGSGQTAYYLDTASNCDGTPREVGQATIDVYGRSKMPQGSPTLSCSLTLNTANVREPHRFKIEFVSMNIMSDQVNFYVYDGEFNSRLMYAFSQTQGLPSNLAFDFTTGQQVTFRLSRGSEFVQYDIHIVVTPVSSTISKCITGNEVGCDEYNYKYRPLTSKQIAYIVGGGFALVFIVVIIIVVCCFIRIYICKK